MKNKFSIHHTRKIKIALAILSLLLFLSSIALASGYRYYQSQLKAVSDDENPIRFTIKSGASTSQIADQLHKHNLIKNPLVFKLYSKLNGYDGKIQAGDYLLKQSMSVEEIVEDLLTGKTKQKTITFYPGATLNFRMNDRDTTPSHKESLMSAGFSRSEVEAAFNKSYKHKLFELMPEATTLEGLIYGDTFFFNAKASLDEVMNYLFDYYYKIIEENDLEEKYRAQGLSLYQGLILASIIEKEAINKPDRDQVAQVFLSRIKQKMKLGSDVTYQYVCRLLGVANNLNIDSPYNTRRYPGFPPTPIATPGLTSLLAVAEPAQGDYLFFLAGDDFKTYFARTNSEHEKNIREHCAIGCSTQ